MPEPLWTPTDEQIAASPLTALMREVGAADYEALWRWSTEDVGRFWGAMWERFDVLADGEKLRRHFEERLDARDDET